jgi:hypothetical protein
MIENGKAKIENSTGRLSILIPSRKNWFALLFGTAWMVGWYLGFQIALATLRGSKTGNPGADGFITFWLVAWTIGGISTAILLLWGYFGQEKLVAYGGEVLFEKGVFGIGQKKRLDAGEIKNIRTDHPNTGWFSSNRWAIWGLGPGKIKFDYGLKTFSFGLAVDEAELVHIVEIMKEYFRN